MIFNSGAFAQHGNCPLTKLFQSIQVWSNKSICRTYYHRPCQHLQQHLWPRHSFFTNLASSSSKRSAFGTWHITLMGAASVRTYVYNLFSEMHGPCSWSQMSLKARWEEWWSWHKEASRKARNSSCVTIVRIPRIIWTGLHAGARLADQKGKSKIKKWKGKESAKI